MNTLYDYSNFGKNNELTQELLANQLILIDGNVPNATYLIEKIPTNAEVIVLNPGRNGIEEITEVLAQRKNLDNIHLISHGNPGTLYLGNTEVNDKNLNNYTDKIREWQKALGEKANLLIYGCSVAAGTVGEAFVKKISGLLSVNIAASKSLTGSSKLGGNWDLEFTIGRFTSELLFNENNCANYGHVLDDNPNNLTGQDGEDDLLLGNGLTNIIQGLGGDDIIHGENPNQPSSSTPEGTVVPQIDQLWGGEGIDTFVFGANGEIYYDSFGFQDYGLVKDFEDGETIRLFGQEGEYNIVATANGSTAIFSQGDLIGLIEGVDLTNTPGAFEYDDTLQSTAPASIESVVVEAFANTENDNVEDIIGSSDTVVAQTAKIDELIGAAGRQNFVLGTANEVWYDDRGFQDYALITEFDIAQDTVQLNGVSGDYSLSVQTLGDGSQMGAITSNSNNDLIGVIMGADLSGLDLAGSNTGFIYVNGLPPA